MDEEPWENAAFYLVQAKILFEDCLIEGHAEDLENSGGSIDSRKNLRITPREGK